MTKSELIKKEECLKKVKIKRVILKISKKKARNYF